MTSNNDDRPASWLLTVLHNTEETPRSYSFASKCEALGFSRSENMESWADEWELLDADGNSYDANGVRVDEVVAPHP